MVFVTVGLAAGVYVAFAGFSDVEEQQGLDGVISQTEAVGSLEPDAGHSYESVVTLTQVTGEPVNVAEVEVDVNTPDRQATLTDLPVDDCPTTADLDTVHTEGDSIFQAGCQWGGVLVESTDDIWSQGDDIVLRFDDGEVPALDDPGSYRGETVKVEVVDESSGVVLTEVDAEP